MNAHEVIDLLTVAATFDRRTIGDADVASWLAVVGDLDFGEARDAVLAHYTSTSDWLMPAHVRQRVGAVRRERLARTPDPTPVADPDDVDAYFAQLRAGRRAIAAVPASSERRSIEGGSR